MFGAPDGISEPFQNASVSCNGIAEIQGKPEKPIPGDLNILQLPELPQNRGKCFEVLAALVVH